MPGRKASALVATVCPLFHGVAGENVDKFAQTQASTSDVETQNTK